MDESIMNDHDIIIETHTMVLNLQEQMSKLTTTITSQNLAMDTRLRNVENDAATCKAQYGTLEKDVEAMQKKSNTWDVILSIATAIGAIMGAIFGNRQI